MDRITRPPGLAGRSKFVLGLPVDPSGELSPRQSFSNIREPKQLLLGDQCQLARNFSEQLIVYATGTRVSFADRDTLVRILNQTKPANYCIRSILHAVVQSELFRNK